MKVLNIILFVLGIFALSAFAQEATVGPCIDQTDSTFCQNAAKDCDTLRFRKLMKEQCRATCGYC